MLTDIKHVKCNVQIINGRKSPEKGSGLVMVKIPKNIIIPLCLSYYIPHNPQNKRNKNALIHYNKLRSVIAQALIWIKTTTYTGKKLKVESAVK